MINTILVAPLAFPLGLALAPTVTHSRTYTFPSASGSELSAACRG